MPAEFALGSRVKIIDGVWPDGSRSEFLLGALVAHMRTDRNHRIACVVSTFQVMEELSRAGAAVSLSSLARATGKPIGTIHRILATLVNVGYVQQENETGKYALTLKMWQLGPPVLSNLHLSRAASGHLRELMRSTNETVELVQLDDDEDTVYVVHLEAPQHVAVNLEIEQRLPSWSSAIGRAMLAFLPGVSERVLDMELRPSTPNTIVDPAKLRKIFYETRKQGYSISKGQNRPNCGGIAAPIRNRYGGIVAACGVVLPAAHMKGAAVTRTVPLVVGAASRISHELGYSTT